MVSLRLDPPAAIGGHLVSKRVDYWDQSEFGKFLSYTDQLPRNVIQYITDSFIVTVRPSGTEPKLKFYCQLLAKPGDSGARGRELLDEVRARAEETTRTIYNELLSRINLSLSEAALWLPDIVDFDRKREFETRIASQLRDALAQDRFESLPALLSWLSTETLAMTPGADPLPALKTAIACLLREWAPEMRRTPRFDELAAWARPTQ
jgi:hypothetical protein